MKAFDTDILTEVLAGNPAYQARLQQVPADEQAVPIVVVEEIIRGRLNVVRQVEAGKCRIGIDLAYQLFQRTLNDTRELTILAYTDRAETLVKSWRQQKVKGSTHDLRIAACCMVHSATLVTRNRRDFQSIPNLSVEFWD